MIGETIMNEKVVTISTKVDRQIAEKLKILAKRKGYRFSAFLLKIVKDVLSRQRDL